MKRWSRKCPTFRNRKFRRSRDMSAEGLPMRCPVPSRCVTAAPSARRAGPGRPRRRSPGGSAISRSGIAKRPCWRSPGGSEISRSGIAKRPHQRSPQAWREDRAGRPLVLSSLPCGRLLFPSTVRGGCRRGGRLRNPCSHRQGGPDDRSNARHAPRSGKYHGYLPRSKPL